MKNKELAQHLYHNMPSIFQKYKKREYFGSDANDVKRCWAGDDIFLDPALSTAN